MRIAVDVEKQVAVTLYYLSDEGRMRKCANSFGIARSTVSQIVRRSNSSHYSTSWAQVHQAPKDQR